MSMRMAQHHHHQSVLNILVVTLLHFLGTLPTPIQAVSAYWWYENATCLDEHTIKGISHLSFDDPNYSIWDTTEYKYYGGCFLFNGGRIDLDTWEFTDLYDYGNCVVCGDLVGCSSNFTSCDSYMTYPPPAAPTSSSPSSYEPTATNESVPTDETSHEMSSEAMGAGAYPRWGSVAATLQQKVLQATHGMTSTSNHRGSGGGSGGSKERESKLMTRSTESLTVVALTALGVVVGALVVVMRFRKFCRSKRPTIPVVATEEEEEEEDADELPSQQDYYYYYMGHGEQEQYHPQQQHQQQQQQHFPSYHHYNPGPDVPHSNHEFQVERITL